MPSAAIAVASPEKATSCFQAAPALSTTGRPGPVCPATVPTGRVRVAKSEASSSTSICGPLLPPFSKRTERVPNQRCCRSGVGIVCLRKPAQ